MRGKRKITALLLGLVLLLAAAAARAASSVSAGPAWVEHEAITAFRPEAAATEADMDRILAASLGGGYELISPMRVDDSLVLGLVRCEKYTADELAALLAGNPDIVRAEKNGIPVPQDYDRAGNYTYSLDDELSRFLYHLNPATAENIAGDNVQGCGLAADKVASTRAGGMWPEGGYTGDEVVVAVIDTGVNTNHEDLKDALWHNPGNIGLPGDVGYNYCEGSTDVTDIYGHGTHVAGLIAAVANNGKGVAGTGAGVNVKIMMLATYPSAVGRNPPRNDYCYLQCMNYILKAKKAGVNVVAVNNSWTSGPSSYLYDEMFTKLGEEGIVCFIAAGNQHDDVDLTDASISDSDVASTVTVGACDIAGSAAGFSNYGRSSVDLFAPGMNVLSTYGGSSYFPNIFSPAERAETTEYYGQFSSATRIEGNTVVPETGEGDLKAFGALAFRAQSSLETDAPAAGNAGKARVALSIDRGKAFTTDAMLKVTIHDPQPDEEYYIYFPYAKNPATTGTDNTLLSIYGLRHWEEGGPESMISGGEIVVEANGRCTLVEDGSLDYDNDKKDSGSAFHVHQDLGCIEEGKDLLLSAEELGGRQAGIGFRIRAEVGKDADGRPVSCDVHFYIDSLAVSLPGADAADHDASYEIMCGTSMASPVAAGCYALVAAANPRKAGQSGTDYVRETLAKFYASVKRTDALEGLCATGGYIDLSVLEKEYPSICDAVSDVEARTLTLYGQHLTKDYTLSVRDLWTGAVTAIPGAGMEAEYAEDGRTLVIRNADALFGTYSEFILSEGGTVRSTRSYFLVKGQAAPEHVWSGGTDSISRWLLTDADAEKIYAYDGDGHKLFAWNGSDFAERETGGPADAVRAQLLADGWTQEQLDDSIHFQLSFTRHRLPAWGGNRLYELAEARYTDYKADGSWEVTEAYYLAALDYTAGEPAWKPVQVPALKQAAKSMGMDGLPEEWAFLDGKVYFFLPDAEGTPNRTCVLACDPATGELTEGAALSGTALRKSYFVSGGGKIRVVFAREGKRENLSRAVYSYDGKAWTKEKDLAFVGRNSADGNGEYGSIEAGAAAADYGLMMFNCPVDGAGNFFLYETDTGECLPLYLTLRDGKADLTDSCSGVLAGNWIYMLQIRQCIDDPGHVCEMYRIPYRNLYTLTPASYTHTAGSPENAVMTAKRRTLDRLTYGRFRDLLVDGETVDPKYYATERGSLVLTISAGFLDTLAPGEHPVRVAFADGSADGKIIIGQKNIPKTGDASRPVLWACMALAGLVILCVLPRPRRKGRRR